MSVYLPDEILIEILARLPVKSLLQFRSVCKSWYSIISSPSFIPTHLNRTKSNHTNQLLLIKYESQNQEHYMSCIDDETFGDEYVHLECPFQNSKKSYEIVGSCNGLLCLLESFCPENLVLWNPSIRKIVRVLGFPTFFAAAVGFGFDQRSNDYKVVKIGRNVHNFRSGRNVLETVQLYALRTRSWRSICVDDFFYELSYFGTSSAFVNGAVHWIAVVRSLRILIVVAFDMGDEVFREMALPNHLVNARPSTNMYVTVLGGSLAVINSEQNTNHKTLHIWVMEEYGVTESWTERSTIIGQHIGLRVVGFRKNGDVLMVEEEEEELVSYDTHSQQIKHLGLHGHYHSFHVVSYMESLVALDGANGVRKAHPNSPDAVANKKASRRKRKRQR